jgi:hypothetical protein
MDLLYKTIEESEWVNQGTYREKKFTFNGIEYRAEWFAGGVSLYADGEDADYYQVPFSDADEGVEYLAEQHYLERATPVQQAVYSGSWLFTDENGPLYKDVVYKGHKLRFYVPRVVMLYGGTVHYSDSQGSSSFEVSDKIPIEKQIVAFLLRKFGA